MARKTVVVVDDDTELRETLQELLTEEGYAVEPFARAEHALRFLSDAPHPDLILLDYALPGASAEGFVRRLHELEISAPILLITAANRGSVSAEVLRVADLLQKPFGLSPFLERVAEASGRGRGPGCPRRDRGSGRQ